MTSLARTRAPLISAVMRSGEADHDPVLVRKIQAGQTFAIRSGQWIVEPSTPVSLPPAG